MEIYPSDNERNMQNSATNIFINMKSWQVFAVLFLPMLFPTFFMGMFSNPMLMFGLVWLIWMALVLLWFYSIGKTANDRLEMHLKKNINFLRTCVCIPLIYGVTLFFTVFSRQPISAAPENMGVIFPLDLLSIFGIFYSMWFAAKQLVTLKSGKRVGFFDYSGSFFLLWFFPIGVWFIQPIVNKELGNMRE